MLLFTSLQNHDICIYDLVNDINIIQGEVNV